MLGTQEVVLILAILLLVFGPTKLPAIGRMIGRAVREFNKATGALAEAVESPIESGASKKVVTPRPVKDPIPNTDAKEKPIKPAGEGITVESKKEEIPTKTVKGE